jgi:hypothetical protein
VTTLIVKSVQAFEVVGDFVGDDLAVIFTGGFLRSEKGPNGNVLIDVFPMNSDASAYESPVGALLGRGAKKPRKPRQRR